MSRFEIGLGADHGNRERSDACFESGLRASVVWDRLDVDIDRVTLTSALAERDLDSALAALWRLD